MKKNPNEIRYAPGSFQNEMDGLRGDIAKKSLQIRNLRLAVDSMENKIIRLSRITANQQLLAAAFKEANPRLYYKLVQTCFPNTNKEKIPEQYRID